MIELFEQYGYNKTGFLDITAEQHNRLQVLTKPFRKTYRRRWDDATCLLVQFDGQKDRFLFETSYFIGVDWIIPNEQPVFVQPKLNDNDNNVDFLSMLFEALEETENYEHLDRLFQVDFNSPAIRIKQEQDILTPFLVVEYLQLLKQIVRKGLKKSYYRVTDNLEARVKGKILINQTILQNIKKGTITNTACQFDVFGMDSLENRILNKALRIAIQLLPSLRHQKISALESIIAYIAPAFEGVAEDVDINQIKQFSLNPIYKEYERALKIAICLLKRRGYNQNNLSKSEVVTPPYWIDMSKLFELYVFKKLREIFPRRNEVMYHLKSNYQEIDFLINSPENGVQMVVDAKYKPRYKNHMVCVDDIRQVCGYARMKKVYDMLGLDYSNVIDCMIIYSHQDCPSSFSQDKFKSSSENDNYVRFCKMGLKLPCNR